jgi:hypothetical protein
MSKTVTGHPAIGKLIGKDRHFVRRQIDGMPRGHNPYRVPIPVQDRDTRGAPICLVTDVQVWKAGFDMHNKRKRKRHPDAVSLASLEEQKAQIEAQIAEHPETKRQYRWSELMLTLVTDPSIQALGSWPDVVAPYVRTAAFTQMFDASETAEDGCRLTNEATERLVMIVRHDCALVRDAKGKR